MLISAPNDGDAAVAVATARALPRWEDVDFVGQVSIAAPYEIGPPGGPLVAIVDYGLKDNIVKPARGSRRPRPRPAAHG